MASVYIFFSTNFIFIYYLDLTKKTLLTKQKSLEPALLCQRDNIVHIIDAINILTNTIQFTLYSRRY